MPRKVTFDTRPPPGTVNFGVGQPSDDLLPVDLMREAASAFLSAAQPRQLNYGEREGDPLFRTALADFLGPEYRQAVAPDSLFLTAGNSQALDFVCSVFTRPGDTVIVEEPSYFLAFRIFEDHGLNIVSVPVDRDGMDIDSLESVLTRIKPSLVYTIPSFNNPAGISMSAGRRSRLADLSREHGFIVAADEVYQLLWFEQPPPPAMGTLIDQGNVLSLGSFSKILAPGLRLGWIQCGTALRERILDSGVVNSGGSFNHFTSLVVREVLASGSQQDLLEHLRASYAARAAAMQEALQEHLAGLARWSRPGGGYFFWLELTSGRDTAALREKAPSYQVGFQPGVNFSCRGTLGHCMRLSFAHYGENDIRQGVARLDRLLRTG